MRSVDRWWRGLRHGCSGVTLVEVLVGGSIMAIAGLVVTSVLLATQASQRSLRLQTDHYESLRIPAGLLTQDARLAKRCSYDWDYLRLNTGTSLDDYIQYAFAQWDGSSSGVPDPNHLHRWIVVGGTLIRDDIVGWDLVAPDPWDPSLGTWFHCEFTARERKATIHFVKPPRQGQWEGVHLEVIAFIR